MFKIEETESGDILLLDKALIIDDSHEKIYISKFELNKLNSLEPTIVSSFPIVDNIKDKECAIANKYIRKSEKEIEVFAYFDYISESKELFLLLDYFYKNENNPFKSYDKKININDYFTELITNLANGIITNHFSLNIIEDIVNKAQTDFYIECLKDKKITGMPVELNTDIEIVVYKTSDNQEELYGISNRCMINSINSELFLCETIKNYKLSLSSFFDEGCFFKVRIKIDENTCLCIDKINDVASTNDNICYIYFPLQEAQYYLEKKEDFRHINSNYLKYKKFDFSQTGRANILNTQKMYLKENNSKEVLRKFYKDNKIKSAQKIDIDSYLLYMGVY